MLDDMYTQRDGVERHENHTAMTSSLVQVGAGDDLCVVFYVRLTLQSDLATETPASFFAVHKEEGSIFYLPELTALPALDEYTVGSRYLQYHILLMKPQEQGQAIVCPKFDALGTSESVQLGVTTEFHTKSVTGVFSQYFLSSAGRGHADLSEVASELSDVLQPVLLPEFEEETSVDGGSEGYSSEFAYPNDVTNKYNDDVPVSFFDETANESRDETSLTITAKEFFEDIEAVEGEGNDISAESESEVIADTSVEEAITSSCSALPDIELIKSSCSTNQFALRAGIPTLQRSKEHEAKLNRLISRVSELSGIQSRLYDHALNHEDDLLRSIADEVDRLYCVLKDSALELRMVSLEPLLLAMKEWLEEAAGEVGRSVQFSLEGTDVQVDAVVAERMIEALTAYLSIVLSTCFEYSHSIVISLSVEYSGTDVLLLLIHPEAKNEKDNVISTAPALVKLQSEFFDMHGAMSVETSESKEKLIRISFPVTQAMVEGLLVQCGDEEYLVPINQVSECIECSTKMGVEAKENKVIIGGEAIPYVRLREYVGLEGQGGHEQCVVIQSLSGTFGLIVDGIAGDMQAAVKPVGLLYQYIEMISGVSIKPNGAPCLVLNLQHLQTVADCLIIK